MNKVTNSGPIIVNIYNSSCEFETELPTNDIINIIQTDIFQLKL